MTIDLATATGTRPRIAVVGVGGAGGNAIDAMVAAGLEGVGLVACNTDAQALAACRAGYHVRLGPTVTRGLGAGARPEVGRAAAEESLGEVLGHLAGSDMAFVAAGLGGGTGTGAAPVIARAARERGVLTVGVVTKPFRFEGAYRMRLAEAGLAELRDGVDALIVVPNQNLFRLASEETTFADAFRLADRVLHAGVRGVTDLMLVPGLVNLDFADVRTVMAEVGGAVLGLGEGEGERRAVDAAEGALGDPLLDDVSLRGARGVLVNVTGGPDMTLFEVDAAATRVREEVGPEAAIVFGAVLDPALEGRVRVSVVATGIVAGGRGRRAGTEGGEAMIHGDATAAALEAALEELGAAEDRAARAGHALAELEELAEEDPAAAAGLDACRRRLAAAEEWLAEVREAAGPRGPARRRRGAAGARGPFRDDGLSAPVASASRPAG